MFFHLRRGFHQKILRCISTTEYLKIFSLCMRKGETHHTGWEENKFSTLICGFMENWVLKAFTVLRRITLSTFNKMIVVNSLFFPLKPKNIYHIYLIQGTILGTLEASVNKTGKSPCSRGPHILNIFDGGGHYGQVTWVQWEKLWRL